jgi:hypothetical protein
VGSTVVISGSNYKAGSGLTVTFDGTPLTPSGTCTADDKGTLPATNNCALTVPAVSAGPHTVTVSDGTYTGSATFTVTPALSLSLNAGVAGSTVTLSGSNYAPNSGLTVTFDGTTLSTSGTCTADASGTLPASNNCAFTVPAATAGAHAVSVSDGTYAGTYAFTVTVDPALSLAPSAGAVGSTVVISGSGYAAGGTILLTFDGSTPPNTPACTADATGSFSNCAFTVPAKTAGSYTVAASDGSANSASTGYTVQPALSLAPSAGAVGSTVTLSGSNYAPNSSLTVTFDGTKVSTSGTCTAEGDGTLLTANNCTFTVPAVSAGTYTVRAKDRSGYFGEATYRVD